ncbi:S8 family serine peptidase [candidate division KSB1 bacterium]|nr:S8 family serine peptidase [candidate division KSB1 bacterium]
MLPIQSASRPYSALVGCLAFLTLLAIAHSALAAFTPGQLIVKLDRAPARTLDNQIGETRIEAIDRLVRHGAATLDAPLGAAATAFPDMDPILRINFPATLPIDSLQSALERAPGVVWVTRNYHYRPNDARRALDDFPNDSLISDEWWLQTIAAFDAWDMTHGDSNIVIGIIDTGIDYLHPDLAANIWHNWADFDSNGIDDDNNGFIDDGVGWDFVDAPAFPAQGDHTVRDNNPQEEPGLAEGHGTYVAGFAAAVTDNGSCVAAIGRDCRLMPLRAGNGDGLLEEDDIAAAILYATANGADILNMSFGDVVVSPLLWEAVAIAHAAGLVLVASAGNGSSAAIHYPSGFPEVISVGATDQLDRRADFSNYGPSVDVMAPGRDLLSTIVHGECGDWVYSAGTSYSSPMCAGMVGLVLSVNPALSPDDVLQLVRTSADDIRSEGWDPETAHGRINARRAVEQAAFGADVIATISSPATDLGMISDFWVTGSAWGAAFDHYDLYYGLGESPRTWTHVATGTERVFDGALGEVQLPEMDTVLVVRLQVSGSAGQVSLDHRHLYVQRSAPALDSIRVQRMLDGADYGDLYQVTTDQVTTASFILTNALGDSVREDFGYVADTHAGFLSHTLHPGEWVVRIRLQNQAGLVTLSESFNFVVTEPEVNRNLWSRSETTAERGYIGPFSTDYDCDGAPEMWLWPIGPELVTDKPLQIYEWNGSDFVATGNTYADHIPRGTGDADADGRIEIMGGNGSRTRIWEQSDPCEPPNTVVFEALSNFYGSGFYDLNPADSGAEIVARKPTAPDSGSRHRFIIYDVSSDYRLSVFDTLPNESAGDDNLGQPKVLVGDLDGDAATDVLYADYDGDLIFCELDGDHYTQRWTTRLPLNDATAWFAAGDFRGTGQLQLVAGCRSNSSGGTESQRRARHWEFFIFNVTGDNTFVLADSFFVLGNEDVSTHPSSVTAADVNADGRDEILLSLYPDLYIVGFDEATSHYIPLWYYFPGESNTALVADWNLNGVREFYFSDGSHILRAESPGGGNDRPLAPAGLVVEPAGPHDLFLSWNAVAGADSYRVYRAATVPDFDLITVTPDVASVLTDQPENVPFTYAVTAIDDALPIRESVFSNYVTAAANRAPACDDTAQFTEPHFVTINFSEPMGESALRQWAYRLDSTDFPSVISSGEGGRRLVLSFADTLAVGWHTITMNGLRDVQNSELPESESTVFVHVARGADSAPHLSSHRLVDGPIGTIVEVGFSLPMDASVLDLANYHVVSPFAVQSVEATETDRSLVRLHLDPAAPVGALGRTARIQLRNLRSESGIAMDTTAGRADLVIGTAATSLDEVFAYPNPYAGRGPGGVDVIMFAGLPAEAHIRIFDLRGVLVREIKHHSPLGGASWDLTNDDHERVAGGVYIFTVESGGEKTHGKLAVLR